MLYLVKVKILLPHKIKQNTIIKEMKLKITFLFFLIALGAFSQKSSIEGIISDKENTETLVGVTIAIYESIDESARLITGTSTDLDGHYSIELFPGNYTFKISYVSYETTILDIQIVANENISEDILLASSSFELKAVEVFAKVSRESEGILLMDRKTASSIEEKIGAKELSKKGISDAAQGVKKITGVSMMGSNKLFVRGLGDRYNSAQLNGLPIASPDPNKKIIKLDIFQTDILQNISVSKAYNAQNYADYTGAMIDITTKNYPSDPFLNFSIGGTYNSQSTFNEFMQIDAEGNRFLGLDVKERQKLTPEKYQIAKKKTQKINEDFKPSAYGFSKKSAAPFLDFAISGGKLYTLKNNKKIGGLFSLSFNNEYQSILNIKELQVNKQNIPDGDFVSNKYAYNSTLTGLGSLSFIFNKNHSINYNLLFINNGTDVFKEKTGTKPDWKNGDETALIRNAQYINYRVLSHQLIGKHQIIEDKLKINWKAAYALLQYQMPDRREIVYWTQAAIGGKASDKEWGYMTYDKNLASKRIITNQNTHDYSANLQGNYSFNTNTKLTIGLNSRWQILDYRSFFYGYAFKSGQAGNLTLAVDISQPTNYFGEDYLDKVTNNSSDQMGYDAYSSIYALFGDFNYIFNKNIYLNIGLRLEASSMSTTPDMNVNDGNEQEIVFDNLDIFPALNIRWAVKENMNIRLAGSRTITRPSFFEKSPALIIPEQGENRFVGNIGTKENPNDFGFYLENAYSNNAEIRWEYFPKSREIISLAAFGKTINEPIENISYIQGGTDRTYSVRNFNDNALVAGLEFEAKKHFKNFSTGINLAYIYTHINVPSNANELNDSRALQGASPYIINADIGYQLNYGAENNRRSYFGIIFNTYGKRLYVVGINEGNQYQLPFSSLDLVLRNKMSEHFSFNISVKNLLNSKYSIVQDVYENSDTPNVKTNEVLINDYQTGLNVHFTLKYKI